MKLSSSVLFCLGLVTNSHAFPHMKRDDNLTATETRTIFFITAAGGFSRTVTLDGTPVNGDNTSDVNIFYSDFDMFTHCNGDFNSQPELVFDDNGKSASVGPPGLLTGFFCSNETLRTNP